MISGHASSCIFLQTLEMTTSNSKARRATQNQRSEVEMLSANSSWGFACSRLGWLSQEAEKLSRGFLLFLMLLLSSLRFCCDCLLVRVWCGSISWIFLLDWLWNGQYYARFHILQFPWLDRGLWSCEGGAHRIHPGQGWWKGSTMFDLANCTAAWTAIVQEMLGALESYKGLQDEAVGWYRLALGYIFMILHLFALFSNFNNIRALSVSGSHGPSRGRHIIPIMGFIIIMGFMPMGDLVIGRATNLHFVSFCAICIHLQHVLPTSTA